MKTILYIPLACEMIHEGAELGPDALFRLSKTFDCLLTESEWANQIVITSAGMGNPEKFPKQTKSMGQMQLDWLLLKIKKTEFSSMTNDQFCCPPEEKCVWSTRAELQTALTMTQKHVPPDCDEIVFTVITSWYHMPRTMFVFKNELRKWKKNVLRNLHTTSPPKTSIKFVWSKGKRISGILWELLKILEDFRRNFLKNSTWSSVQNSPF